MRFPWSNPSFTSKTSKVITHPIYEDGLLWNTHLESRDSKRDDIWSGPVYIIVELCGELP